MLRPSVYWWGRAALATAGVLLLARGPALSQQGRPLAYPTEVVHPLRGETASVRSGLGPASASVASPAATTDAVDPDYGVATAGDAPSPLSTAPAGGQPTAAEPRPTLAERPTAMPASGDRAGPASLPPEGLPDEEPAAVAPATTAEEASSPQAAPIAESSSKTDETPLVPIPQPQHGAPIEIGAASFKGVTPGKTSLREIQAAWGPPREVGKQDALLVHLYAVEPFDRVEVSFVEETVASIVIRLNQAFPAEVVAEQLELAAIRPVLISNDLGEILGQSYPERGVLFALTPGEEPGKPSMQVVHIILEPITAEPFVLRAETHLETRPAASLADLDEALKLQPDNARAHWLRARLLAEANKWEEALKASAEAVRIDSADARFAVTRAQVLGQAGEIAEAVAEARRAVAGAEARPHVQARALCLLGDLLASGPNPDYREALQYHTEAIRRADPLVASPHPAIRLAAKEVMIDAHLGAAHDIAWGTWKEKEVSVPRWLGRAAAFADEMIRSEGASQEHMFRVSTRALAVYVGLRGAADPTEWTERTLRTGESLLETDAEPGKKAQQHWDLGMALYDALQIHQMRGENAAALRYGQRAVEHLEAANQLKGTAATGYLLGRLYFRLGAIHALGDQNHRAAVTWFAKAVPLLEQPLPKDAHPDLGRQGETFVSMGVSYWEIGQRQRALELTQRGVTLIEQAVRQGTLDKASLAIPYGNLASMHRQLGAESAAERFEELANGLRQASMR